MTDLFPITLDDMVAEAQREVALRERVYPRWIENGRLTQEKADRHLAVMREIVKVLQNCKLSGGLPPDMRP